MFPISRLPLFTYGNLMPGMPLWDELSASVERNEPASVIGRLFWHASMRYPLLVPDDHGYSITGHLTTLAASDAVNRLVVVEELMYGYDARWLEVRTDAGEVAAALVLVWTRPEEIGPEIESGDYARARRDLAPN